jgi:Fungalysin metallopeptidase (M36)/Secretion system C-terminal sorting domain/Fungalysin/Thermolysin Propeptide Motif
MHMRKCLALLTVLTFTLRCFSQSADLELARQLVQQNKAALTLTDNDISNSAVSASYIVTGSSIRMVYLQQTYRGLPVFNKIQTLAFKDGKPVSAFGQRIPGMEQTAIPENGVPLTTASMAVQAALTEANITTAQPIIPLTVTDNGNRQTFGNLGIAGNDITATLLWAPDTDGNVQLAWQVELAPRNTSDHWLIRISANDNKVIDKNNYTVYCSLESENAIACADQQHMHNAGQPAPVYVVKQQPPAPFIVNGATYNVIPYPAESPIHPGGTPANRTDPWLLSPAGSNATSLKWNSTGATDYTITRGNNVYAYEDRNADNIAGIAATSSTSPDPLTFGNVYNFTLEPIVAANQQAAITNLFYWNNIIHDVSYLYGFDEVAGNFQVNNQSRGGAGNDAVNAEAQDGGGTNNANMSTPADGSAPRMQMYLWTAPTPDRDGDLDNGIILHEYTHGISNRLTGGPATTSCLGNQEQMGEGWSDYFGLMLTQDWASSLVTDGFNKPRGIGTYALNQPITGVGIRQYPYTTNMAVNPFTYSNITTVAVPHGIGSVWCTMLWDMTWDMIQLDGINPNLFNASGVGGNIAALKLVTEGMRLQPCSPGFVDGRNAILKADTLFFGARYSCIIWKAFARRGVGVNASQGLSSSRSDQVVDFTTKETDFAAVTNVTQQSEGQNIIYTNTTSSICANVVNYKLVDTLPTNVTHVSGGTYNSGNRTVTFSGINLTAGTQQVNTFTVKVNAGAYFIPTMPVNEAVAGTVIPAGWTATSTTADVWRVTNTQSVSAPNSFFTRDTTIVSDQILATNTSVLINGSATLSFSHLHNAENLWDGGVVEISTNNGTTWSDLGNYFISNGYTSTLNSTGGNPLAGRRAFSGNSVTFKLSVIDLSSFKGQNVRIRFRFGSDNSTGTTTGWFVDDIVLKLEPAVIITSQLFDAADVLKSGKTLVTKIVSTTLPLNLLSFSGYMNAGDIPLQWTTENEVSTRNFEVQRSVDGVQFSVAGQVPAYNLSQRSNYYFTDRNIAALNTDRIYYRLKMTDQDGRFTYSNILRFNLKSGNLFTISPNPVKDRLYISGFRGNGAYEAVVTDMTGKTVLQTMVSAGNHTINTTTLAKGMYLLELKTASSREVYRFVRE